ncbi:fluoride efflux transporter FluC [Halococcoides cellulosivorans]|uniref:fluoride efflux transporter FluC n=1 Tax=Halococcoides cellulosivorans TaxID=1679096 RepID=UPI001F16325D|nr:CrcB family protein [Halococcoides cellulosivorans]
MTSLGRLETLLFVAAGGFAGAIARHVADTLAGSLAGTLAANVAGAALLGVVLSEPHADRLSTETRLLVGTGFCSSLSTYSTFALETTRLAGVTVAGLTLSGVAVALAYVALTYTLGFGAILAAQALTRGVIR